MTMSKAWLIGWWQARNIRKSVAGLTIRLRRTEARLDKRRKDLGVLQKRIVSLAEALADDLDVMQAETQAIRQGLDELTKQQKQYEAEVEALRSRVHVAEDVTIPSLVAANKLVLERYDADTAVHVRRQVLQQ